MDLGGTLAGIKEKTATIEVYGLGYVGFPLAVRLAKSGFGVVGIDTNKGRIARLGRGELLSSELYLQGEFAECAKKGRIALSGSPSRRDAPKVGIICVPTPIPDHTTGSDVHVMAAVGSFLSSCRRGDAIILESSIEVGTTERVMGAVREAGFGPGVDLGVCTCPERIDPANKDWKLDNIPRVIYCSDDTSFGIASGIYRHVNGAELVRVPSPKTAEVVKSFENAFRLVNISLVNELAILCDRLGISVRDVISAASTKPFGFVPHYPGAGAGGHCIPKDPQFLLESARKFDIEFTTIQNALRINSEMPEYIAGMIEGSVTQKGLEKTALVCGLSYKSNMEDMRDSPGFRVMASLKGRGFEVSGYDPYFNADAEARYLRERGLGRLDFAKAEGLGDDELRGISCLCIVQHHDASKDRIAEAYRLGKVPLIYDCQHKLERDPNSETSLEFLGE